MPYGNLDKIVSLCCWASYRLSRRLTNGVPHHIGLALILGVAVPVALFQIVLMDSAATLSSRGFALLAVLVGPLIGAALFLPTLFQFTPFRRLRTVAIPSAHSVRKYEIADLGATGIFHLDPKVKERFPDVSCHLAWSDSGEAAAVVHVDASSYFMGGLCEARKGIWILRLGFLAGSTVEEGTLLFGSEPRPALRIKTPDGKQAILTCGSEDALNVLRDRLAYVPAQESEKCA